MLRIKFYRKSKTATAVLSVINYTHTPLWQDLAKRGTDIIAALMGLLFLSPLLLYVAIRVRLSSKGPVIYSQERVGMHRKKFRIHKFRSMVADAETLLPMLSTKNDNRITAWGKTMRRWKLDELPQLWNVLTGEMSLVGPRPEREFFIAQLEADNHPYELLLQVKPGLTSLGMIRFGYAENLRQMAERMKYDLVYLEKRSLTIDLKIIFETLRMIFASEGK